MTLPPDILRSIKDLARRVQNLETTPQPPNIQLSGNGTAIFDLLANSQITLTATLTDDNNARLLAQPNVTLYKQEPTSSAGRFPEGSDWSDSERMGIRFSAWTDWGDTDNENVVLKIHIVNTTATDYEDLFIAINMRFMTRGGSF